VILFNIWKQIKKRLRRGKRPLLSLGLLIVLMTLLAMGYHTSDRGSSNTVMKMLQEDEKDRQVHLTRQYVSDKETLSLGLMNANAIIQLMLQHPEWSGHVDQAGEVWLTEEIDDISSSCKENGFIGVDKEGNITLYEGPPKKEKVMRTFFQVDIESMESSLPKSVLKELHQGIRVSDVDEYNSVLSTFSDYAIEQTEKVMKHQEP
jgi:forespore regulator of the sigma-K checkpoint